MDLLTILFFIVLFFIIYSVVRIRAHVNEFVRYKQMRDSRKC